jgi:hypothetical protein
VRAADNLLPPRRIGCAVSEGPATRAMQRFSPANPIVLFEPLSLLSAINGLLRHSWVRSPTGVSSRVRIWQGAFTGLESIAGLQATVMGRALPPA